MAGGGEYGVIWDMDGTLVDTAELHLEAWAATAREFGKPFTRADFEATFGRRNPDIIHQLLGRLLRGTDAAQHDREHAWIGLDGAQVGQIGAAHGRQHQPRRAQDPQRVHVAPRGARSVAIAAIDAVEQAKISGPFSRCPPPVVLFILGRDALADLRCDL